MNGFYRLTLSIFFFLCIQVYYTGAHNPTPWSNTKDVKLFMQAFLEFMKNSKVLNEDQIDDMDSVADTLWFSMDSMMKSGKNLDHKLEAMNMAFASSMTEIATDEDSYISIDAMTNVIAEALRSAFYKTTGKSNEDFINEIKFLINMIARDKQNNSENEKQRSNLNEKEKIPVFEGSGFLQGKQQKQDTYSLPISSASNDNINFPKSIPNIQMPGIQVQGTKEFYPNSISISSTTYNTEPQRINLIAPQEQISNLQVPNNINFPPPIRNGQNSYPASASIFLNAFEQELLDGLPDKLSAPISEFSINQKPIQDSSPISISLSLTADEKNLQGPNTQELVLQKPNLPIPKGLEISTTSKQEPGLFFDFVSGSSNSYDLTHQIEKPQQPIIPRPEFPLSEKLIPQSQSSLSAATTTYERTPQLSNSQVPTPKIPLPGSQKIGSYAESIPSSSNTYVSGPQPLELQKHSIPIPEFSTFQIPVPQYQSSYSVSSNSYGTIAQPPDLQVPIPQNRIPNVPEIIVPKLQEQESYSVSSNSFSDTYETKEPISAPQQPKLPRSELSSQKLAPQGQSSYSVFSTEYENIAQAPTPHLSAEKIIQNSVPSSPVQGSNTAPISSSLDTYNHGLPLSRYQQPSIPKPKPASSIPSSSNTYRPGQQPLELQKQSIPIPEFSTIQKPVPQFQSSYSVSSNSYEAIPHPPDLQVPITQKRIPKVPEIIVSKLQEQESYSVSSNGSSVTYETKAPISAPQQPKLPRPELFSQKLAPQGQSSYSVFSTEYENIPQAPTPHLSAEKIIQNSVPSSPVQGSNTVSISSSLDTYNHGFPLSRSQQPSIPKTKLAPQRDSSYTIYSTEYETISQAPIPHLSATKILQNPESNPQVRKSNAVSTSSSSNIIKNSPTTQPQVIIRPEPPPTQKDTPQIQSSYFLSSSDYKKYPQSSGPKEPTQQSQSSIVPEISVSSPPAPKKPFSQGQYSFTVASTAHESIPQQSTKQVLTPQKTNPNIPKLPVSSAQGQESYSLSVFNFENEKKPEIGISQQPIILAPEFKIPQKAIPESQTSYSVSSTIDKRFLPLPGPQELAPQNPTPQIPEPNPQNSNFESVHISSSENSYGLLPQTSPSKQPSKPISGVPFEKPAAQDQFTFSVATSETNLQQHGPQAQPQKIPSKVTQISAPITQGQRSFSVPVTSSNSYGLIPENSTPYQRIIPISELPTLQKPIQPAQSSYSVSSTTFEKLPQFPSSKAPSHPKTIQKDFTIPAKSLHERKSDSGSFSSFSNIYGASPPFSTHQQPNVQSLEIVSKKPISPVPSTDSVSSTTNEITPTFQKQSIKAPVPVPQAPTVQVETTKLSEIVAPSPQEQGPSLELQTPEKFIPPNKSSYSAFLAEDKIIPQVPIPQAPTVQVETSKLSEIVALSPKEQGSHYVPVSSPSNDYRQRSLNLASSKLSMQSFGLPFEKETITRYPIPQAPTPKILVPKVSEILTPSVQEQGSYSASVSSSSKNYEHRPSISPPPQPNTLRVEFASQKPAPLGSSSFSVSSHSFETIPQRPGLKVPTPQKPLLKIPELSVPSSHGSYSSSISSSSNINEKNIVPTTSQKPIILSADLATPQKTIPKPQYYNSVSKTAYENFPKLSVPPTLVLQKQTPEIPAPIPQTKESFSVSFSSSANSYDEKQDNTFSQPPSVPIPETPLLKPRSQDQSSSSVSSITTETDFHAPSPQVPTPQKIPSKVLQTPVPILPGQGPYSVSFSSLSNSYEPKPENPTPQQPIIPSQHLPIPLNPIPQAQSSYSVSTTAFKELPQVLGPQASYASKPIPKVLDVPEQHSQEKESYSMSTSSSSNSYQPRLERPIPSQSIMSSPKLPVYEKPFSQAQDSFSSSLSSLNQSDLQSTASNGRQIQSKRPLEQDSYSVSVFSSSNSYGMKPESAITQQPIISSSELPKPLKPIPQAQSFNSVSSTTYEKLPQLPGPQVATQKLMQNVPEIPFSRPQEKRSYSVSISSSSNSSLPRLETPIPQQPKIQISELPTYQKPLPQVQDTFSASDTSLKLPGLQSATFKGPQFPTKSPKEQKSYSVSVSSVSNSYGPVPKNLEPKQPSIPSYKLLTLPKPVGKDKPSEFSTTFKAISKATDSPGTPVTQNLLKRPSVLTSSSSNSYGLKSVSDTVSANDSSYPGSQAPSNQGRVLSPLNIANKFVASAASRLSSAGADSRISTAVSSLLSKWVADGALLSKIIRNLMDKIGSNQKNLSSCDIVIEALLEIVSAFVHIISFSKVGKINFENSAETAHLVSEAFVNALAN